MAVRVMDRPKHRWFIVSALIVGVGLQLLARPWMFTTQPARVPASVATIHPAEPLPDQSEPSAEAASTATTTTPAATPPPSEAGGTFRGRVIDAVTRKPVPEFEVRLGRVQYGMLRQSDAAVVQTFQSKTGRFAWKRAPAGKWDVAVAARGYQPFEIADLTIDSGEVTRELVLPLMRGYTLRGRVFDKGSGGGIGGATIEVREPRAVARRGSDAERYEQANADGSFVIEGVPGGDIVIGATARGHAPRYLEVVVDDSTEHLEIGLSAGGTVAGVVVAQDGQPVSGFVMLGSSVRPDMMKLDETGAFSFPNSGAGRYVLRANTTAGTARHEFVLAEDERRVDIVLKVVGGRSIRGVITGLTSEQLKQTHVSLQSKAGYFQATVDDRGAYALSGVPPGRASLTVRGMSRMIHRSVDVPADKDMVLELVFPPGSRLTGRVTQGGKPIPDTAIWLQPVSDTNTEYLGRTGEDGRYQIDGIVAGEYNIRAEDDISRRITIAGDAKLDIDIPSLQLGGRVIEDGTSVPVVDADVFVRGMEAATSRVHNDENTDHFGNFQLTGLEPGAVTLSVYKPGYEMYREQIAYASPITNRIISLRRSSGVEIRVHASNNEPHTACS